DGATPLFIAAYHGYADIVSELMDAGANIDQANNELVTPLAIAVENGLKDIVKILVDYNANVNTVSTKGETTLYLAAKLGKPAIVSLLLEANADADMPANNGLTPLMIAEKNGHDEAVQLLRPQELLALYKTQIINAVKAGKTNLLAFLLTKLTDPNIIDKDGNNLLHLAVLSNKPSVLQILLEKSIDAYCLNKNNETPLTLSIKSDKRSLAHIIHWNITKPTQFTECIDIEIDKNDKNNYLGRGGFGEVYKGRFKDDVVAVKTIHLNPENADAHLKEIDAMQQCRSPYVLHLIAVYGLNTKEPKLVLEYMDCGDLRTYLEKKKMTPALNQYSTMELAWVIANGLNDIHHNGLIHRDLKSRNILLSSKHYIKIADLGLTRSGYNTKTKSVGTLCWTAPEVYTSTKYGSSADIYSFGVILTELDTLNAPYSKVNLTYHQLIQRICNGLRPTVSDTCPTWYKALVDACLALDPAKRPSASDIVKFLREKHYGTTPSTSLQFKGSRVTQSTFQLSGLILVILVTWSVLYFLRISGILMV
ncbi:kinase, partial [Thraustotheca clavata]